MPTTFIFTIFPSIANCSYSSKEELNLINSTPLFNLIFKVGFLSLDNKSKFSLEIPKFSIATNGSSKCCPQYSFNEFISKIIFLSKVVFLKIKSTLYCREKSKSSKSLLVY